MKKPENIDASKIDNIIFQHACIAGAAGLVPFPFIDMAIMLPQQIVLYGRLNREYGVALSKDAMKVVGSFMISQITGMVSVFGIALAAKAVFSPFKAIPGLGTLVGVAADATTNAGVSWVLGVVYFMALDKLAKKGRAVTQESLKAQLAAEFADKSRIREIYRDGRKRVRGVDFAAFKRGSGCTAES